MAIPVVDFQVLSEDGLEPDGSVVEQLHSAFSTIGFAFITSHGIDRKLVDQAFAAGEEFFSLPVDKKESYLRARKDYSSNGYGNGYVCMEMEGVDPTKPSDLKEAFDVCEQYTSNIPETDVLPSFKPVITKLYDSFSRLSLKILEVMGYGLKLKDPQLFVKAHKKIGQGTDHNFSLMRLLEYPPLLPDRVIKPGQLRCGEHVDYGAITLLFQDPSGGLQVKRSDGGYIDVPYTREAVLVNLGGLMQNWTADVYLATPHRVLLPEEEERRKAARRSMVFFVHPDNEVLVECVDGSNKYPAVTAAQDTIRRLDRIDN